MPQGLIQYIKNIDVLKKVPQRWHYVTIITAFLIALLSLVGSTFLEGTAKKTALFISATISLVFGATAANQKRSDTKVPRPSGLRKKRRRRTRSKKTTEEFSYTYRRTREGDTDSNDGQEDDADSSPISAPSIGPSADGWPRDVESGQVETSEGQGSESSSYESNADPDTLSGQEMVKAEPSDRPLGALLPVWEWLNHPYPGTQHRRDLLTMTELSDDGLPPPLSPMTQKVLFDNHRLSAADNKRIDDRSLGSVHSLYRKGGETTLPQSGLKTPSEPAYDMDSSNIANIIEHIRQRAASFHATRLQLKQIKTCELRIRRLDNSGLEDRASAAAQFLDVSNLFLLDTSLDQGKTCTGVQLSSAAVVDPAIHNLLCSPCFSSPTSYGEMRESFNRAEGMIQAPVPQIKLNSKSRHEAVQLSSTFPNTPISDPFDQEGFLRHSSGLAQMNALVQTMAGILTQSENTRALTEPSSTVFHDHLTVEPFSMVLGCLQKIPIQTDVHLADSMCHTEPLLVSPSLG